MRIFSRGVTKDSRRGWSKKVGSFCRLVWIVAMVSALQVTNVEAISSYPKPIWIEILNKKTGFLGKGEIAFILRIFFFFFFEVWGVERGNSQMLEP